MANGVIGAGVLADGQGAGGIGLEPDPAGAEEADALGDELFLEASRVPHWDSIWRIRGDSFTPSGFRMTEAGRNWVK